MKRIILFLAICCTSFAQARTIYCMMEYGWWTNDGAGISCRAWNGTSQNASYPGLVMTPVTGERFLWSIDIDDSFTHCMFVRCQGGTSEAVYFGAQTGNIAIPTDGRNFFIITNEEYTPHGLGKECEGYWSTYPALNYYLIGHINNADYSGDDYLFEDGMLEIALTDTAYVAIKDQNNRLFQTQGDVSADAIDANFYLAPSKPGQWAVPGPSNVTFYLTENEDGSVLLEYDIEHITALDAISLETPRAIKKIENGQMVIVRGDKVYTILGTEVK